MQTKELLYNRRKIYEDSWGNSTSLKVQ